MKKLIKLIGVLLSVTLVLVGCIGPDESAAQKVAKEFGTELFTVDSKKISGYNSLMKINDVKSTAEAMQSNDKSVKSLMTEDGYNTLIANRYNTINTQGCAEGDFTMQVTDFTLSKNLYDIKENKSGYYFEAELKLISNKDRTEKKDVGKGYIGLSKVNGQWKVSIYKIDVLPKLISEALKKQFIREIAYNQLTSSDKEKISETWQDSKLSTITLKEGMGNIIDKSYIGKEVYMIDFTTKSKSKPNNMIVYLSMDNNKLLGYGYVD